MYSPVAQEARNSKSRNWQRWFLPEALSENLFLASLLASCIAGIIGVPWPADAPSDLCLCLHSPFVCMSLCVPFSLS